jgi:chromosome segregation ATPase
MPMNKWDIEPEPEMMQPASAPLFVKIDRYRNILSDLGSIKAAIGMLRTSFGALNELERARQQTMGVIQAALEKVDKRLGALDTNLVKPTGFTSQTGPQEQIGEVHNVEGTIADLRGQIQQLKSELQQM